MNYRIKLEIGRTASEMDIRKNLNLQTDHVITRRDVENFGRLWQTQITTNREALDLVQMSEIKAEAILQ